MVTGGAGFLDTALVRQLREAGASEIFIPKVEDYDLRKLADIDRALADARPDLTVFPIVRVGWRLANALLGRFGNKMVVIAERDQSAEAYSQPPSTP
jgi:hypothetical protein